MKTTLKIAKAELSTLFYSPIAWLLGIIFLFQCALTYITSIAGLLTYQDLGGVYLGVIWSATKSTFGASPYADTVFSMVASKVYLYIPLLTMGIMSREISSGTIKLLYSSPIRIGQVIFGKFVAMMAYNFLLILILAIFVISAMFNIKSADLGIMLSGLLGIYLLLCAYTAIGLFMSCLTSYQVVAAISTLVVFAALAYVGTVWQGIDFVRDLTYFLSISGRTDHMLRGLISTKDVLYFLLVIFMFLSFSIIKLQAERESKSGLIAAIRYLFIFLSVLITGYITGQPGLTAYYDATATKTNTLTPNTQKMLEKMGSEPLQVTSYINLLGGLYWHGRAEDRNNDLEDHWQQYLRFKPDIKLKYVYYYDNPLDNPTFFSNYPGKSLQEIAARFAKATKIDLNDFKTPAEIKQLIDLRPELNRYVMQLKFRGKTTFLRLFDDKWVFPLETETDAALMRLMVKLPKIAFLDGEFERSKDKLGDREYAMLTSQVTFRYALVNQGFDVETISLKNSDIPADISAMVIADPKTAFTPDVLAKIQQYINNGGNLLIAGEPGKQAILNPLIKPLGVQLTDGTLVQQAKKNFPINMVMPFLTKSALDISSNLQEKYKDSIYVTMTGAAGLTYNSNGPFRVMPLLTTDARTSWNKKGKLVIDSADVAYDAAKGDEKKAFPLVLGLTRMVNGKLQRIVVSGDADFLSNAELSRRLGARTANFQFATDVFGWFTYGQFPIDTERPSPPDDRLNITDAGLSFIKILDFWIFPGLILIAGTVFLVRRKRK